MGAPRSIAIAADVTDRESLQRAATQVQNELGGADARVIVIEPRAIDTELTSHITDEDSKRGAEQLYEDSDAIPADEVADVIAFAVGRPQRVSLNEIFIRPTQQSK